MKNRNSKDINEIAFKIAKNATEPKRFAKAEISQIMAHMGRQGGLKGGKARALSLSAERRKEIAQKAAKSRWKKDKNDE